MPWLPALLETKWPTTVLSPPSLVKVGSVDQADWSKMWPQLVHTLQKWPRSVAQVLSGSQGLGGGRLEGQGRVLGGMCGAGGTD